MMPLELDGSVVLCDIENIVTSIENNANMYVCSIILRKDVFSRTLHYAVRINHVAAITVRTRCINFNNVLLITTLKYDYMKCPLPACIVIASLFLMHLRMNHACAQRQSIITLCCDTANIMSMRKLIFFPCLGASLSVLAR
jgi:hypothetical protein